MRRVRCLSLFYLNSQTLHRACVYLTVATPRTRTYLPYRFAWRAVATGFLFRGLRAHLPLRLPPLARAAARAILFAMTLSAKPLRHGRTYGYCGARALPATMLQRRTYGGRLLLIFQRYAACFSAILMSRRCLYTTVKPADTFTLHLRTLLRPPTAVLRGVLCLPYLRAVRQDRCACLPFYLSGVKPHRRV